MTVKSDPFKYFFGSIWMTYGVMNIIINFLPPVGSVYTGVLGGIAFGGGLVWVVK